jgi:uncharacterized membrane protein YdjX (TVP38/TMEM64 family)
LDTPYHPQVGDLHHDAGSILASLTSDMAEKCTRCAACQQACAFLRKYGTPGEVAQSYDPADKVFQSLPFECSLCQLCTVVCPVKLKPFDLFLEMRREKIRRDPPDFPEHADLLSYEKLGTSRRFTHYAIPESCDTVFFPGCTLAGRTGREMGKEARKHEAAGRRMITCCAGCTNRLDGITPTSHIVDLLWEPEATMVGKVRIAKAPFTYLNRLKLKRKLKQTISAPIRRERTFTGGGAGGGGNRKKGMMKRVLLLGAIVAVILAIRLTGATRYLEQETLRRLIGGYGGIAPFIYMLIYALAPSLLLPGLPITLAGGILFGPFWGVVYAITGATIGACIAFLVARYVARDWVERKLRGPQWRRLDEGVEKHGWKVVAFTRLIPLFPFNLLNYAFGLTRIKFLHYAVATFFCMLPACIAFIVFSSSLLDVLKGRISLTFVAGLVLVILVSLMPFLYGRYKKKRGIDDPL